MIKQYTKALVNASGEIVHVTSQTVPFKDGIVPTEDSSQTLTAVDFEMEIDVEDMNFRMVVDQPMMRGREILENLEVVGGKPQLKAGAVTNKVLKVSDVKDVSVTAIKAELATKIRADLLAGGSSEDELMLDIAKQDPDSARKLVDLSPIRLMKITKALAK